MGHKNLLKKRSCYDAPRLKATMQIGNFSLFRQKKLKLELKILETNFVLFGVLLNLNLYEAKESNILTVFSFSFS
jgi:hypothetical protein